MAEVERLAVIGSGTMGHGIAQLAAMQQVSVTVFDVDEAALGRARAKVVDSLDRFAKKETISREDADSALERISWSTALAAAVDGAQFVVEAVPEVLDLKQAVFGQLQKMADGDAVLASNTSQLSVTAIAAATSSPGRVVGMHFFNPPVRMRLIEIVRGISTTDETLARTTEFAAQLGKENVVCQRDTPGFITTRAIMALRLECMRMYEEGIASIEDLDKAMRLAFNHPMGQFELNDFNGLDIALQGARNLREAYGERFAPPPSLVARVAGGKLGRKTGSGWYDYPPE